MIARNETFSDITIHLDGSTFVGCTFERCTIVYSGIIPCTMTGNSFSQCQWQFIGPAQNALGLLSAFHAQGGEMRVLVEQTFDNLRKAPSNRRAGDPIILN